MLSRDAGANIAKNYFKIGVSKTGFEYDNGIIILRLS